MCLNSNAELETISISSLDFESFGIAVSAGSL